MANEQGLYKAKLCALRIPQHCVIPFVGYCYRKGLSDEYTGMGVLQWNGGAGMITLTNDDGR